MAPPRLDPGADAWGELCFSFLVNFIGRHNSNGPLGFTESRMREQADPGVYEGPSIVSGIKYLLNTRVYVCESVCV